MFLGSKRWLATAAAGSTAVVVSMLGVPSQAADPGPAARAGSVARGESTSRTPGYFDARRLGERGLVRADRQRISTQSRSVTAYHQSLGSQAVIDIDALTGTPRNLGRLDGFLSGRSPAPARDVAISFVRRHLDALGLTSADLATLRFDRDYVDPLGLHHLSWSQHADGTQVFGNGLEVQVTRDGRVLAVQGSPVSGLQKLADAAPSATRISAASARSRAAADVGGRVADARVSSSRAGATATTRWSNQDYAQRVWFLTPQGLRPGWSTYVQAGGAKSYQHVVDAVSGDVLFRRPTVASAEGDALVYDYYPGARRGGSPRVVNFLDRGWLVKRRTFLNGDSVVAWTDVDDDNALSDDEKTPVPGTRRRAQFRLDHFGKEASSFCSAQFVCTWNPNVANSWRSNRRADATQAFYLASNFHEYLAQGPIGFNSRAGNFSRAGGDPVLLNALDGADTNDGFPDGRHIDNANMSTPPDGIPPTMQMYLWHVPGATDAEEPFLPTSSAFDASVEYHEYTHGLSNRLVVDSDGNSTLNSIQAGAMGEAWSDYYAMDYLVAKRFQRDTDRSGEVFEGKYLMAGREPLRTMAIDCATDAKAKGCTDRFDNRGGYTYGDFPTVGDAPEVHRSGEVWGQTLWDLRKEFGHRVAAQLITRAMSISADDPDYLDMRNAILQADLVAHEGDHIKRAWRIFADRGMGWFAGSVDAGDAQPAEDFHVPPAPFTARDVIAGTVIDEKGDPVRGALVRVTGHGDRFEALTNAKGEYVIRALLPGTYRKVLASAPGFFPAVQPVNTRGDASADFQITRDFAAKSGGAEIVDFNGPDFTESGCGPDGAIDLSLGTGWGSTTGDDRGTPTNEFVPKFITVDMHTVVDIDTFGVDPNAACGDPGSASTGRFRIETSPDRVTWTTAAQGEFTPADRGRLNDVTPIAGTAEAVRFVRFTILGNQTPDFATNCPDGPYTGCVFTDLTELAVFGSEVP
jgi:extracellular elastinolytic metalloproteinase